MPYRFRKLLNYRLKLEVNYPMEKLLQKYWIVHFLEKGEKYIDTEELIFPTNLTEDNIKSAIEEAKAVCKDNDYEFICLDLIDEGNWTKPWWSFPRDLECFS